MPYYYDKNIERQDDEEDLRNPYQLSSSANVGQSGNSAMGGPPPQNSGNSPSTGSGFHNLNKYLQANNSTQFGQDIQGRVQGDIDLAKSNQDKGADQYQKEVQRSGVIPTGEQIGEALKNPGQANPEEFQKWMHQYYSGPHSLADSSAYDNYWSGTKKAQSEADLLTDPSKRPTLLNSFYGRPHYTQGQKLLDSYLYGHSGLQENENKIKSEANALISQGNKRARDLSQLAPQRMKEISDSQNAIRSQLGVDPEGRILDNQGKFGTLNKNVRDSIYDQNRERKNIQNKAKEQLQSGVYSQDFLNQLGLSPDQRIFNVKPSDYATMNPALEVDQVFNPEQQNYLKSLEKLSNISDPYLDEVKSFRAKTVPFEFDQPGFNKKVNDEQSSYNAGAAFLNNEKQQKIDEIWQRGEEAKQRQRAIHPQSASDFEAMYNERLRAEIDALDSEYNQRLNNFGYERGVRNVLRKGER